MKKSLILALVAIILFPVLSWGTDITTLVFYEKNKHLFGGGMVWGTDTIKVDLISSSYTPDSAADDFYNDCSANTSTAGAVTLGTKTASADAGTGEGTLGAANITIVATGTWRYFVVFKDTGNSSTSPLLYYGDAGTNKVAGSYIISWTGGVLMRIQ